jgi:lipopolysaccharide heptosyltransferase I
VRESGESKLPVPSFERLVIVKLSSIGDVVHALPVASALRRTYPRLRITWAVEDWVAALVRGHGAVDRVVTFPRMRWAAFGAPWVAAFRRAAGELRREPYDICLDLQGLLKSSLVAVLSGASTRLGAGGQREAAGLVSRTVPGSGMRCHVVEDNLSAAAYLGAATEPVTFDLAVDAAAAASVAHRLAHRGLTPSRPLVVINPSSSVRWKHWPVERWARVARVLATDAPVVVVGSRDQRLRHAEVVQQADAADRVFDLTGETTLAELVALLARCTVHVAPDTGSAHIAAALGVPVIGLYGPTPTWRKAPYGQSSRVVHYDGLCGAGCPRFCMLRQRCLTAVEPDALITQARQVLRETVVGSS